MWVSDSPWAAPRKSALAGLLSCIPFLVLSSARRKVRIPSILSVAIDTRGKAQPWRVAAHPTFRKSIATHRHAGFFSLQSRGSKQAA